MDGSGFNARSTQGEPVAAGAPRQRTLRTAIGCAGVGLHSGARVNLSLNPAPENHGIVFLRRDIGREIPARFDHVADTRLCTVLALPDAPMVRVGTVEHVMAALAGTGITNATIMLDGPEVPILDGSAEPFLFLIRSAGIRDQDAPAPAVAVRRIVRVSQPDGAFVELLPPRRGAPPGLAAEMTIDFPAPAIGRQHLSLHLTPQAICDELSRARTFTLRSEVDALQAAGLARGGSLANAVVVDGASVLNAGGLRMEQEFVRHKLLDAVGDMALAGVALHGRLRAERSGHALNNRLLRQLFADASHWAPLGAGAAEGAGLGMPAVGQPPRIAAAPA